MSYGLKLLRAAGLVTFSNKGRVVRCSLVEAFPHPISPWEGGRFDHVRPRGPLAHWCAERFV